MRQYDQVDINVVMGSGGMFMAPVIRDVGSMGVKAIADATAKFEDSIFNDEGEVMNPAALGRGTFSIHNLGKPAVVVYNPIFTNALALPVRRRCEEHRHGYIKETRLTFLESHSLQNNHDEDVCYSEPI